jgi:Domain of unknown function (DUF4062)
MPNPKIYISSTFRDLKEYRAKLIDVFRKELSQHFDLTKIMELMFDDGTYTPYVQDCVAAVAECDIYIIILGNKVGSFPPGETRTYTEIELDTAIKAGKKLFILNFATFDENEIDNKEKHNQILKKFEGKPSHPFTGMMEFELSFLRIVLQFFPKNSDKIDLNEIYFCDRKVQDRIFEKNMEADKAIQFHLLSCNERDMPDYFVKRKVLEFAESNTNSVELFVNPTIIEGDDYEMVETAIKSAIKVEWNKNGLLSNYKIKPFDKLNFSTALKVLDEINYDYFIIAWEIRSIYWKSDDLKAHLNKFYKNCAALNAVLNTKKKIFLIGVLSYTENSTMSESEFLSKIQDLQYGKEKIQFSKITNVDIKEWIEKNIAAKPERQIEIINEYGLNNEHGYYMSEIEDPLRKMFSNNS